MFWVFREKSENPLPGHFLMLCAIQNFIKIPYVMLKLLLLYLYHEQDLHSDEMCYKACVPLCGIFSNRN